MHFRFQGFTPLLLALMGVGDGSWISVQAADSAGVGARESVGFRRVHAAETGLAFTNRLEPRVAAENQIRLNGSGVAAGDVDGDGQCDLYFTALGTGNRLFRNRGGWRFEDVTPKAGDVAFRGRFCTGVVLADVDGDGDLDLLVGGIGIGTSMALNDGHGVFTLVPDAGLDTHSGAMSMTLADVDGDGDLDLYVANYRSTTIRSTGFSVLNLNGRRIVRPEDRDRLEYLPDGRILEHGEPDVLYLNDGRGHWTPVDWTRGMFRDDTGRPLSRPPFDWSLSAMFRDINRDGAPDLYVCGDFQSPDHFWLNDGRGGFQELPRLALRNTPTFSMSVDFGDLDRDGTDDFLVTDMLDPRADYRIIQSIGGMAEPGDYERMTARPQVGRNTLQMNRGDGTFAEQAYLWGLEASGWTWAVALLDVDLDGYEDVLTANGHLFDTQDRDANQRIDAEGPYRQDQIPGKLLKYPPLLQPKLAFHNLAGRGFEEVGSAWGFSDDPGVAHGICLADLDGDGDLDVVVNQLNGEAAVYRNESTAPRLGVRLRGNAGNTRGIGARVLVRGGPVSSQSQEMICGGRYLSGDEALRVFAAGKAGPGELEIEVRWRSGKRSLVRAVDPGRVYEVSEAAATDSWRPDPPPSTAPLFADESRRLGHRHFDRPFDDFLRQPLLPHRLSQNGPGAAWWDLNGDGRDDLVVGSGTDGRLGVFLNNGEGGFTTVDTSAATEDQTGLAGWVGPDGRRRLLVATSGYESGQGGAVQEYDPERGWVGSLDLGHATVTALALADVDADGALDLFVGGGAVGGQYPRAGESALYWRRGGQWEKSTADAPVLKSAGLVNGAVWTDLDGDGFSDLVLACEWGPVRVYRNDRGRLHEVTEAWGFAPFVGWWRGVGVGDFDEDGRLDLVVGNWGANSRYRVTPAQGPRLYWGELNGSAAVDLVEATYETRLQRWLPERDLSAMAGQFPWLRAKYPSHHAYARAGIEDLLGDRLGLAKVFEARCLTTTLFLNRGGRFDAVPLPREAQVSPVTGVSVGDWNGDGHPDLLLAQNFFAEPSATSRSDAGRGLVLLGDGRGGFRALAAAEGGVQVYGEQRGTAVGDYDGDGRLDVVVTQNGESTMLFHNVNGQAGTRVRLRGPAGNRDAIGAAVRLRLGGEPKGGVQEVRGGGGWWSQDAPTLVFPRCAGPWELDVRWPGGRTTRHAFDGIPPEPIVLESPRP